MITQEKRKELLTLAAEIRTESINMISEIGVGHVGGSLSIADLMAVLYGGMMQYDAKNPKWENRDRIVLSKGHAGPAMYAALGLKGFFPRKMFHTLNQPPTNLPSHTDMNRTPGVDMTTGSLGQGASSAAGIALGCKLAERNNFVYLIIGDGESQEGQVWEAANFAAAQKLDNLIAIVDYNGKQLDAEVRELMGNPRFADKFTAFNWNAIDVSNGNDVSEIWNAIETAKSLHNGKPTAIVLHTTKGKGWHFAEENGNNHSMKVTPEQAREAAVEFAKQRG